ESDMNCKNILIVRLDPKLTKGNEVKDVSDLLETKYKDRNPQTIDYSETSGSIQFKPVVSQFKEIVPWDEWKPTIGDTGIYVVQEGCGTNNKGFKGYLHGEAVRKAFAEWLLALTGEPKNLKIRKLSFLACCSVQTDQANQGKATAVAAATDEQEAV